MMRSSIDFKLIADNLEPGDGIWQAKSGSSVSYPQEGNELCAHLEEDSFWFRHRNNCIVEMVRGFSPRGPLFDVGGGNGFTALALENSGFETVLVEPGETGVANARERGLVNIVRSTLEDAGFHPHALPAAGLFDVLEHIREPRAFLTTLFHLLEPGGRLYITVPAFRFLWSRDDDYAGHFERYTRGRISKVLADTGYHVEYAAYIFCLLPLPIFLFQLSQPNWDLADIKIPAVSKGIRKAIPGGQVLPPDSLIKFFIWKRTG